MTRTRARARAQAASEACTAPPASRVTTSSQPPPLEASGRSHPPAAPAAPAPAAHSLLCGEHVSKLRQRLHELLGSLKVASIPAILSEHPTASERNAG
jgi:hypothetical protein